MPADETYSILGFINTWKLYHKYMILHYLKVWNVGWFSYHVGLIVKRKAHNLYSILMVWTCGQAISESEISQNAGIINCKCTGCETGWVSQFYQSQADCWGQDWNQRTCRFPKGNKQDLASTFEKLHPLSWPVVPDFKWLLGMGNQWRSVGSPHPDVHEEV